MRSVGEKDDDNILYQATVDPYTSHQNSNDENGKWEILKNLTTGQEDSLVSGLPSRNDFLAPAVKDYANAGINVFCFCLILLDFVTFGRVFSPGWKISQIVKINIFSVQKVSFCHSLTFLSMKCMFPGIMFSQLSLLKFLWLQ